MMFVWYFLWIYTCPKSQYGRPGSIDGGDRCRSIKCIWTVSFSDNSLSNKTKINKIKNKLKSNEIKIEQNKKRNNKNKIHLDFPSHTALYVRMMILIFTGRPGSDLWVQMSVCLSCEKKLSHEKKLSCEKGLSSAKTVFCEKRLCI